MPSDAELQKKYPKDFEILTGLLKNSGVALGDAVKVATNWNSTYCGFYVGNSDAVMSAIFNKTKQQYDLGEGGLTIILSIHSLESYKSAPHPDDRGNESIFIKSITLLEKLVSESK